MDPQPVLTADAPAAFSLGGFHPLCLTIHGTRLSASGPIVAQPVTASACNIQTFPVFTGTVSTTSAPLVAITHAGPHGTVEVAGHARPRSDPSGQLTPNLLVHFADDHSVGHLQLLDDAVRKVSRPDAATAILAVMTPEQMKKARFVPSVSYAEDQDGAWEKLLGVRVAKRPATLLVGQGHKVAWQHEGAIDGGRLVDGLRTNLKPRKTPKTGIAPAGARVGQLPPNIVFEIAPGRQITLRKLAGRAAILVFWKSASKASIDAVRDILHGPATRGANPSVVLAVNDGDPADLAKKIAAGQGLTANLVLDPNGRISGAYGVRAWPTTVYVNTLGVITRIQSGREPAAQHT
jgi:peroxiredoxin